MMFSTGSTGRQRPGQYDNNVVPWLTDLGKTVLQDKGGLYAWWHPLTGYFNIGIAGLKQGWKGNYTRRTADHIGQLMWQHGKSDGSIESAWKAFSSRINSTPYADDGADTDERYKRRLENEFYDDIQIVLWPVDLPQDGQGINYKTAQRDLKQSLVKKEAELSHQYGPWTNSGTWIPGRIKTRVNDITGLLNGKKYLEAANSLENLEREIDYFKEHLTNLSNSAGAQQTLNSLDRVIDNASMDDAIVQAVRNGDQAKLDKITQYMSRINDVMSKLQSK
jgi:hypothetical protein